MANDLLDKIKTLSQGSGDNKRELYPKTLVEAIEDEQGRSLLSVIKVNIDDSLTKFIQGDLQLSFVKKDDVYFKSDIDSKLNNINREILLIPTTYATISSVSNKADKIHNHDSMYAEINHEHDDYITFAATDLMITNAKKNILDDVPSDLDTLNKLAAAINYDDNFYTNISSEIDSKIGRTEFENQLLNFADIDHLHDDRYYEKDMTYTRQEIDDLVLGSSDGTVYVTREVLNSELKRITTKLETEYMLATAITEELSNKVNVHPSKDLSTNDFTDTLMAKLMNIDDHANLYVHPETHNVSMIEGLHSVATTGNYNELENTPIYISEFTNDKGYVINEDMEKSISDSIKVFEENIESTLMEQGEELEKVKNDLLEEIDKVYGGTESKEELKSAGLDSLLAIAESLDMRSDFSSYVHELFTNSNSSLIEFQKEINALYGGDTAKDSLEEIGLESLYLLASAINNDPDFYLTIRNELDKINSNFSDEIKKLIDGADEDHNTLNKLATLIDDQNTSLSKEIEDLDKMILDITGGQTTNIAEIINKIEDLETTLDSNVELTNSYSTDIKNLQDKDVEIEEKVSTNENSITTNINKISSIETEIEKINSIIDTFVGDEADDTVQSLIVKAKEELRGSVSADWNTMGDIETKTKEFISNIEAEIEGLGTTLGNNNNTFNEKISKLEEDLGTLNDELLGEIESSESKAKDYTDGAITNLINGASDGYTTLYDIEQSIESLILEIKGSISDNKWGSLEDIKNRVLEYVQAIYGVSNLDDVSSIELNTIAAISEEISTLRELVGGGDGNLTNRLIEMENKLAELTSEDGTLIQLENRLMDQFYDITNEFNSYTNLNNTRIETLENNIESMETSILDAAFEYTDSQDEIIKKSAIDASKTYTDGEIVNIEGNIEIINTSLNDLSSTFTNYKNSIDQNLEKLNNKLGSLEEDSSMLNLAYSYTDDEIEKVNTTITNLENTLNEKDTELEGMITGNESEIRSINDRLTELTSPDGTISNIEIGLTNYIDGEISKVIGNMSDLESAHITDIENIYGDMDNLDPDYNSLYNIESRIKDTSSYIDAINAAIDNRISIVEENILGLNNADTEIYQYIDSQDVELGSRIQATEDRISSAVNEINDEIENIVKSHQSDINSIYGNKSALEPGYDSLISIQATIKTIKDDNSSDSETNLAAAYEYTDALERELRGTESDTGFDTLKGIENEVGVVNDIINNMSADLYSTIADVYGAPLNDSFTYDSVKSLSNALEEGGDFYQSVVDMDLVNLEESRKYTDRKVAELVDGAPEALDTLKELANALGENENFASSVLESIGVVEGRLDTLTNGVSNEYSTLKKLEEKIRENAENIEAGNTNTSESLVASKNYTDGKITEIIGGASEEFNSFGEIESTIESLSTNINNKNSENEDRFKEIEETISVITNEDSGILAESKAYTNSKTKETLDAAKTHTNTEIQTLRDTDLVDISNTITELNSSINDRITNLETNSNTRFEGIDNEISNLKDSDTRLENKIITDISNLINGASDEYNTLKKIEDIIVNNRDGFDEFVEKTDGNIININSKIDAINNETTGILALSKEYTNNKCDETLESANTHTNAEIKKLRDEDITNINNSLSDLDSRLNSTNDKLSAHDTTSKARFQSIEDNIDTIEGNLEKTNKNLEDHEKANNEKFAEIKENINDLGDQLTIDIATSISKLVDGASENYDTLKEIEDVIVSNKNEYDVFVDDTNESIDNINKDIDTINDPEKGILVTSKAYTENQCAETLNTAKEYSDNRLAAHNTENANKFNSIDQSISNLETRDTELEKKINDDISDLINNADEDYNTLKDIQDVIVSNREDYDGFVSQTEGNISVINSKISAINDPVNGILVTSKNYTEEQCAETLKSANTHTNDEIKKLRDEDITNINTSLSDLNELINTTNERITSHETSNNSKFGSIDQSISELEAMDSTLNNKIDTSISNLINNADKEYDTLKDIQDVIVNFRENYDSFVVNTNGSIDNINKDIGAINDPVNGILVTSKNFTEEQCTETLNTAKSHTNDEIKKLRDGDITNINTSLENLDGRINETNNKLAAHETANTNKFGEIDQSISNLEAKDEELKEKINTDISNLISGASKEYNTLKKIEEVIVSNREDYNKFVEQTVNSIEEINDDIDAINDGTTGILVTSKTYTDEQCAETLNTAKSHTNDEIKKLRDGDITNINNSLSDLDSRLNSTNDKLTAHETANTNKFGEIDESISALEAKDEELKEKINNDITALYGDREKLTDSFISLIKIQETVTTKNEEIEGNIEQLETDHENDISALYGGTPGTGYTSLVKIEETVKNHISDINGEIEELENTHKADIEALYGNGNNDLLSEYNSLYNIQSTVETLKETVDDNKETAKSYTDNQIALLVDSAPAALNTLRELANALGDDENFSTTILNNIAESKSQLIGKATTYTDLGLVEEKIEKDIIPGIEDLVSKHNAITNTSTGILAKSKEYTDSKFTEFISDSSYTTLSEAEADIVENANSIKSIREKLAEIEDEESGILAQAKSYTDGECTKTLASAKKYTEDKVAEANESIASNLASITELSGKLTAHEKANADKFTEVDGKIAELKDEDTNIRKSIEDLKGSTSLDKDYNSLYKLESKIKTNRTDFDDYCGLVNAKLAVVDLDITGINNKIDAINDPDEGILVQANAHTDEKYNDAISKLNKVHGDLLGTTGELELSSLYLVQEKIDEVDTKLDNKIDSTKSALEGTISTGDEDTLNLSNSYSEGLIVALKGGVHSEYDTLFKLEEGIVNLNNTLTTHKSDNEASFKNLQDQINLINSDENGILAQTNQLITSLDTKLTGSINTVNTNLSTALQSTNDAVEALSEKHKDDIADLYGTNNLELIDAPYKSLHAIQETIKEKEESLDNKIDANTDAINALKNGVSTQYDTLKEIEQAIEANIENIEKVTNDISYMKNDKEGILAQANKHTDDAIENLSNTLGNRCDALADDISTKHNTALTYIDEKLVESKSYSDGILTQANAYTDTEIDKIVNEAPDGLDTLKDIATALGNDSNFASTINNNFTQVNNGINSLETELKNDIAGLQSQITDITEMTNEEIEAILTNIFN